MIDKQRIIELDRKIEGLFKDPDAPIDEEFKELNVKDKFERIDDCYYEVLKILQSYGIMEVVHYIIVSKLSYIRRIALYATAVEEQLEENDNIEEEDDGWIDGYY